jgi:prolyl-tRNA editing enzyme YbaK/EbsC (Cys-tRNA(Pro) deacylase)
MSIPSSPDRNPGSDVADHPRVRTVVEALEQLAATGQVRVLPDSARTAAQAAAALGTEVGAIVNSLVFDAGGEPLLVLTSGAHRVDTAAVAERAGVPALDRAAPEFVRTHTGFAIGGVSPVGHPAPVRTLVDRWLARHETVWAAAGHPHAVFPTSYDELLRLTNGEPVDVE